MQPIRLVIADDEPLAISNLKAKLATYPHLKIVACFDNGDDTLQFLQQHQVDLVFLDIQMPGLSGLQLAAQLQSHCHFVFCTAFDQYALDAFELNALDYLLKPVDEDELTKAIDKCKAIIERKNPAINDFTELMKALANPQQAMHKYKERFIVNIRNQWMPINTKDIACFSKEMLNYVYLLNGEKYMIDYVTLEEVEELLDPRKFYRANRQFIINIEAIQTVKPVENSKLIIKLREPNHKLEIDMSRLKSPEFKKWMDR
mgnify:CR=1 FL=1